MKGALTIVLAVIGALLAAEAGTVYDIVIYGSTPAALSAAVQAKRMRKRAVVVSPEKRIGGLTTGGLGQTDIGNKKAFGGLALEFYAAVADYYRRDENWKWQSRRDYLTESGDMQSSMWKFEPHAALAILEGWEKRDGLEIVRDEWLDRASGVIKRDGRIESIVTMSGKVYRGKVFIDATYEGDLMAAAGVPYFVGREGNDVYGESLNGVQIANATGHQLESGISPYIATDDPAAGLLPGVEPYDPNEKDGDGDSRVQAYCYRMCLTDVDGNRIPFRKPANYKAIDYELLIRNLVAQERNHPEWAGSDTLGIPWINSQMPNRKTDTNNRGGFSTDFVGNSREWAEASYAERDRIAREHLAYQQGLMWTLANDPRVPDRIRNVVSRWGTCRDEFVGERGDGWQNQLYVREARRMVGAYVMTEDHCWGKVRAPHPIAKGAYQMDSHNVRRFVGKDGFVHNEGDVQKGWNVLAGNPYGVDYGSIVPKRGDCANLMVPVCLSASHIAFGSIRMEPVFFALGQAAATAAVLSIDADVAVQDVDYQILSTRLRADGQVF